MIIPYDVLVIFVIFDKYFEQQILEFDEAFKLTFIILTAHERGHSEIISEKK